MLKDPVKKLSFGQILPKRPPKIQKKIRSIFCQKKFPKKIQKNLQFSQKNSKNPKNLLPFAQNPKKFIWGKFLPNLPLLASLIIIEKYIFKFIPLNFKLISKIINIISICYLQYFICII